MGLYNTSKGSNGIAASQIVNKIGQYEWQNAPHLACDGDTNSDTLSYGTCSEPDKPSPSCCLNTGFYVTYPGNALTVVGFRVCSGNSHTERDPMTVTLEGSQGAIDKLMLGSSWTLMYEGRSGLPSNPVKKYCGDIIAILNSRSFNSYRFLVTGKRGRSASVQFSEVQLRIS